MSAGRVVAVTGARPGLGATGVTAEVAALAARAGNRVLAVDAVGGIGDGALGHRLGSGSGDALGRRSAEVRAGLRLLRGSPLLAREEGGAADLVLLDAGASPEGRRAAAEVADHLVLLTAPEPQAIERLVAEIEIAPGARAGSPSLLGVVVMGLPAEPRQPFAEVRRLLRARFGETLPVLDRPVRSAPFAAWMAHRHGVPLHELLHRPDVLAADHPRRAEVAGLAADHRHLGRAMIEAIDRAEQGAGEPWTASWRVARASGQVPQ